MTVASACRAAAAALVAPLAALAGCTPEPGDNRFSETGQPVALSGGDAGPRAACFTCHGRDGEGDGNLVPRLAGLDRGYILAQLELYESGQRDDPHMYEIARRLRDRARLRVAAYCAALPWPPPHAARDTGIGACPDPNARMLYFRGDADRGLPACAACHGEAGEGRGRGNPPLAGQPPAYLAEQLHKWRVGERHGDPGAVMHHLARALTPAESARLSALVPALESHSPESPEGCP